MVADASRPEPDSYRRVGLVLFSGSASGQAFDLLSLILLTRMLGLAGFGVFVAARAVAGFANHLLTARSWEAVLAIWPSLEYQGEVEQARLTYVLAVWIESGLVLLGVLLLGLAGTLFPNLIGEGERTWLLLILAFLRPAAATLVEVNQAAFRLLDMYWTAAAQGAAAGLLRFLGLLALALMDADDLILCFAVEGAGTALSALIGVLLVRRVIAVPILCFPRSLWKAHGARYRSFVSVNWVASCAQAVTTYGAELMLIGLASDAALGAYGLARRLVNLISLTLAPFLAAVTPQIARLVARRQPSELKSLLRNATRDAIAVLAVVNVVLITFRVPLTQLVGGEGFGGAAMPLVLLSLALSIHFATSWLKPLMLSARQVSLVLLAQVGMGVVLLVAAAILVPPYQASGAALAVLLGYVARTMIYCVGLGALFDSLDGDGDAGKLSS